MQRRFERARVTAGARLEPVTLADGVVERRVGVERRLVGVVQRREGLLAVRLLAARRENRAVLAVRDRDLLAVRQRDLREPRVGGRERRVRVVGRLRQAARRATSAVRRPRRARAPAGDRGSRSRNDRARAPGSVAIQPRTVSIGICSSSGLNHDSTCFHRAKRICTCWRRALIVVVALIFVVLQRRVIPHAIRQLPERLRLAERLEQRRGALSQRAFQLGVFVDAGLELLVGGVPRRPSR